MGNFPSLSDATVTQIKTQASFSYLEVFEIMQRCCDKWFNFLYPCKNSWFNCSNELSYNDPNKRHKDSCCNKVILMPNSFVVSMEYAKLFLISKLHYS